MTLLRNLPSFWSLHLFSLLSFWSPHLFSLPSFWSLRLFSLLSFWSLRLFSLLSFWSPHLFSLLSFWSPHLFSLPTSLLLVPTPLLFFGLHVFPLHSNDVLFLSTMFSMYLPRGLCFQRGSAPVQSGLGELWSMWRMCEETAVWGTSSCCYKSEVTAQIGSWNNLARRILQISTTVPSAGHITLHLDYI